MQTMSYPATIFQLLTRRIGVSVALMMIALLSACGGAGGAGENEQGSVALSINSGTTSDSSIVFVAVPVQAPAAADGKGEAPVPVEGGNVAAVGIAESLSAESPSVSVPEAASVSDGSSNVETSQPPLVNSGVVAAGDGPINAAVPEIAPALTYRADQFVNSVGVNVHLHNGNTVYYDSFDLVKSRLIELGVRHVRDGLIDTNWLGYYERYAALGAAGIRATFIVSPTTSTAAMEQYPSRMPNSFEAYEAPNEYDASGDANWVATLRSTMIRLRKLRDNPVLSSFLVVGPSLTKEASYARLGDISSLVDVGNLHNYFAGRNPGTEGWRPDGYGSIDWNIKDARSISAAKPIMTTETGYWDNPSMADGVPQDVVGRYMPRLLLEQFRKGISRTYIYELADSAMNNGTFNGHLGLLDSQGVPKPSFSAVKNLMRLLTPATPQSSIRPLPYTVTGGDANLRHMAFQKGGDGAYVIAIWSEKPGYDVHSRLRLNVAAQQVTLTLGKGVTQVHTSRWQDDGEVVTTAPAVATGSSTVTVSDSLTVLEVNFVSNP